MNRREAAIAGCGPAGLATALLLSRQGWRVRIFERFETPKPVGSGLMLQPTGLAALGVLGLDGPILADGARIERLFGKSAVSGRTVLDVRYGALGADAARGLGVHRAALFGRLYDAALAADLEIVTGQAIVAAPLAGGGRRRLAFASGGEAGPFDLVVDALGAATPLGPATGRELPFGALWATVPWPGGRGFDETALEQRYVAARRMIGLLPVGRRPGGAGREAAFFWSLKRADFAAWQAAGLDAWKAEATALWPEMQPILDGILSPEDLTFARYAHRTLKAVAEPGLIHIGDAWRSTSPQLGQGANMALLDAVALAEAVARHGDLDRALAHAVALRRWHVRLYQAMSLLFTPAYQSDGAAFAWFRDWIAAPLSNLPPAPRILAAIVAGAVGAPLRRLGLKPPSAARSP